MLYAIAHVLRRYFSPVYEWLEDCNSLAFGLRYRGGLKAVADVVRRDCLPLVSFRQADGADAPGLALFFSRQPKEAFEFFQPHAFDETTLRRLLGRTSFMAFVAESDGQIVGYYFLRSFVHGVAYLGKIVDAQYQGQGIGSQMCLSAMHVCQALGLRMFESISRRNPASMCSSASVLRQVIVKELGDDDLLIEDLPRHEAR